MQRAYCKHCVLTISQSYCQYTKEGLRPRAATQREEGLDDSAGLCLQLAHLQDPGTNACLVELMVLREVVFVPCVYTNKSLCPLALSVTAKSGN